MSGTDISDFESRLSKWVRENQLPTAEEIQARIDAVDWPRAGRRGRLPRPAALTVVHGLIAREWQAIGYSVTDVARGLSSDPRLGLPRESAPGVSVSRDQVDRELRALEQRVKRARAALRRLEEAELRREVKPQVSTSALARAADALKVGAELERRRARLCARAWKRGLYPDGDPACLEADEECLKHRADSWSVHNSLRTKEVDDRADLRALAAARQEQAQ